MPKISHLVNFLAMYRENKVFGSNGAKLRFWYIYTFRCPLNPKIAFLAVTLCVHARAFIMNITQKQLIAKSSNLVLKSISYKHANWKFLRLSVFVYYTKCFLNLRIIFQNSIYEGFKNKLVGFIKVSNTCIQGVTKSWFFSWLTLLNLSASTEFNLALTI